MSKMLSEQFAEALAAQEADLVEFVRDNSSAIWAALKEVERQRAERDKRIRDAAADYTKGRQ